MNIRFLLVWLALLAAGCAGPSKVLTDFDPSAEFSAFRTFAFTGLTDKDQGGVLDNSLLRKRIEAMVGQQLTAKGLQQFGSEERSDLLVHFWVAVKDKQRVESTSMPPGAYGGRYGWGPNYPYGGGYGAGAYGVTTYEYQEGTLIVDLVESSKKELVWRATIVGTLSGSPEENLKMVDTGVAKAFEDYPPARKK
jgi:hypothetical protein